MTTDQGQATAGGGRAAAFGFIFASSLMNAISFGIMIPILPNLIKQLTHGDVVDAARWNVLFASAWGLMQFFFGPILGMLSDRYGRRPIMLVSIFGLFIDFMFMALAPSLGWLFFGRVFNGITASSFSTANAYVADISAPDQRARRFGILGSAFGFGFMIGPSIGGVLGEITLTGPLAMIGGLRLPFVVAGVMCMLNAIYGLLVLPESLPRERRSAVMAWGRANPLGSLQFVVQNGRIAGLITVVFLFQLAFNVMPSVGVLYTGHRYGWTPRTLGFTFMATGACQILVQMFLVGPVVRRLGERAAVLLGTGIAAMGALIFALAPTGWIYLLGTPFWALSGFTTPGLQGLLTRRVPPTQQGRLQGVSQSLQGIASIVGPPLFGYSFAFAVGAESWMHLPGLPQIISACLMGGAFLLALRSAQSSPAKAG